MTYKCIVTTSWDDGYPQDVKLAELLKRYGVKGTFYITTSNQGDIISEGDIIEISKYHEIGSHTHRHIILTAVEAYICMQELRKSKEILERILGKECISFCYPRGAYNAAVKECAKKAGYRCARTTQHFHTNFHDPFEMHPTLHASKYGITYCVKGSLKLHLLGVKHIFDWVSFAKRTFDYVYKHGGVWHLWGHSWELEQNDMWDELEEVLKHVSGREDVKYVSNGALSIHNVL
jgi:peptidoglycan/xylan/chitin deacetylase (PgdA/CDA1 family)